MNIILRNFYRLIKAGVFNEVEQLEPMSAWKWRRVYQYSFIHNVAALTYDGIEKCKEQFFLQLPDDLADTWKATAERIGQENEDRRRVGTEIYGLISRLQFRPILVNGERLCKIYDNPNHRCFKRIELFFPFETQGKKACQWAMDNGSAVNDKSRTDIIYTWNGQTVEHRHHLHVLTNKILNHSLQNIIEEDIIENKVYIEANGERCEVTSNTLTLLTILLQIAHHILNNMIFLNLVVDLGVFLRKDGDKVDFVKLQNWIERLRMTNIAHLTGLLLIEQFNFSTDEIPFLKEDGTQDAKELLKEMFLMKNEDAKDWIEQQDKDILIPTIHSLALFRQLRQTVRNINYYPSESFTNFFANIARSLSYIDE